MTCHDSQNALLQTPDPAAPAEDVAAHLAECAECQEFRRRLLRIETNVLRLPVPASRGLAAFKSSLLQPSSGTVAPTTVSHSAATPLTQPSPSEGETVSAIVSVPARFIAQNPAGRRLSSSRRLLLAGGVAAGLLVGIIGIYQLLHRPGNNQNIANNPHKEEKKPTPDAANQPRLLAQMLECDIRLATAERQTQRTEIMAEVTGYLQDGIDSQPDAATLKTLAVVYRGAVIDGLVPSAQALEPEDRARALTLVMQDLARFHDQASKLASNDPAVRDITNTAAEGKRQLAALLPDGVNPAAANKPARKLNFDWKRDLPLLQAMATAAQKLVLEKNPLKRARFSHELAVSLGREIKQAASNRLGSWAVELGQYHQRLLSQAIAVNVGQARSQMTDREELKTFVAAVAKSSEEIETDLRQVDAPGMQEVVQALASSRREVEMNAASSQYEPEK